MRSREEIEEDLSEGAGLGLGIGIAIEVLLDIRELLEKENKK